MLTPIWSKPSQSPPSASTSGVKAIPSCSTLTGEDITAARMLSVLITACEAVLHEIQDIKWED